MLTLEAHGYHAAIAPNYGASLTALDWQAPDGARIALLAPLVDPAAGLRAGCFVMAPFANRIADGRFDFGGQVWQTPVNRPEEGMAIHGHARDRAWQVHRHQADRAVLGLSVDDPDLPWQFEISQTVTLSPEGVTVALGLTNRGPRAMPFGMGLHPWFPKPAGARLSFASTGSHFRDARGLPLPETRMQPGFDPDHPLPLPEFPWFDGCFSGWTPPEARIDWPGQGVSLHLRASGALRHLHVYVPDDRAVFCAEPVSHLPDAVNRPGLGAGAAMTLLAPGDSMDGAMTLTAIPTQFPHEVAR